MTEYVYKLKNGKLISAYADEKGNISITREALEILVNSWNDGYEKGRADAIEEVEREMYYQAFMRDHEVDGLQKWDNGNWIRYKLFENVIIKLKEQSK